MKKTGLYVLLGLVAAAVHGSNGAETGANMVTSDVVEHSGYSDCIRLENEHARVILGLHGGGRVLEYSWKGENAIYLDAAQNGWKYGPEKSGIDPYGGRLDIGPEVVIPRHPDLWLGSWEGEITGPGAARLISVEDAATGVQLVREFQLDPVSSQLTCTQIIRNISDEDKHWCHWSRTLAQGGGICLIPLTRPSRFPNNYIMYGPGPVMNYLPNDPNILVRQEFLEITGPPSQPKLGMDSCEGWLGYLMRNDLLFVKRFPTYPDRVYNEMAGLTISIYYCENRFCELEPIGPMEHIPPGGSVSFTETWWLLPFPFPEGGSDLDLDDLSERVNREAR
ncbi:MAG: hypothetical protein V1800_05215 [Candidatus Latescibacterota bacterium]